MKECSKCHEEKSFSEFSPRSDRPGKYMSWCRTCDSTAGRARYWADSDNIKAKRREEWHRGKRYGLTEDQVTQMYEDQQYRCAWCGRHEDELDRMLFIDHCHKTGLVRRLLCFDCNTAEGRLQAFPEALLAIEAVAWYNTQRESILGLEKI